MSRTSIVKVEPRRAETARRAATVDAVEIAAGAVDVPEVADVVAVVVAAAVGVTAAVAMAGMVATAEDVTKVVSHRFPRVFTDSKNNPQRPRNRVAFFHSQQN